MVPLSPETLARRLAHFPRVRYGPLPTPLAPLPHLTREFGGPQLWIKRDDNFGPGMGGNKGRKLEFLMAEALDQGRRRLVTYGGLQSNHVRMTAAACAHAGIEAHLCFFSRRPTSLAGNLLLDHLFGARLHFIPFGGGGDGTMTLERTNRLVRMLAVFLAGPRAYFVPVGGHSVTGCLGYVAAAVELQAQAQARALPLAKTVVVTAAGTGGTLAGLVAGFTLLGSPLRVMGLDIGKLWKAFPASIARLVEQLGAALGVTIRYRPEQLPLVEKLYAGPGYASFTPQARQAIYTLARTEGILLDPVYTGKAFAGLLDLIAQERFGNDEHVIFLHSGGLPGLWAYGTELLDKPSGGQES